MKEKLSNNTAKMLKKLGGEGEAEGTREGTVWKAVAQKVEATIEEQGADPGLRG